MRTPPPPSAHAHPSRCSPDRERGFTLIEMIVALALFALISLAGIALLNTVLQVQRRSDGRLTALADLQRAIYLFTTDLKQLDEGPSLDRGALGFSRHAGGASAGVRYLLTRDGLRREIGAEARTILPAADRLEWRFHLPDGTWRAEPPPADDPVQPDAVRMLLHLRVGSPGLSGEIQRTVALPAR